MTNIVDDFNSGISAVQQKSSGAGFRRGACQVVDMVAKFQVRGISLGGGSGDFGK